MQSSSSAYDWKRFSPAELGGYESVNDAVGVLRDALAAVINLETLLRSPKVGPKALQMVVPGLLDQRRAVTEAMAALLAHIADDERVHGAMCDILAEVTAGRERFGNALDRASKAGLFTARERLSFQAEVERFRCEMQAFDELVRLLVSAKQARPTELDLREAIEHAFLRSQREVARENRPPNVTVRLSLPHQRWTLVARPSIVTPLVTIAVALVHRATGNEPSIVAEARDDGWLRLIVSEPTSSAGEVFSIQTPVLVPCSVPCAQAAAQAAGGAFEVSPDERSVEIRWRRC